MVTIDTFRKLALSFPEAKEEPHFEKSSFRIKKKIFATLDIKNKRATLKFSEIDQSVFCSFDSSTIYPVTGIWGKHGWTNIELQKIRKDMLKNALTISFCNLAQKNSQKNINNHKVKKIKLDNDIKIFYVTAQSFPIGIGEAHNKLHEIVPFSSARNYFGLSRPENEKYEIIYRAGAEEIEKGEAEKFGCESLIIPKGNYISIIVNDYKKDVMLIGKAFMQLLKEPDLDPQGYCIEWYATDKEAVNCMIRLNE